MHFAAVLLFFNISQLCVEFLRLIQTIATSPEAELNPKVSDESLVNTAHGNNNNNTPWAAVLGVFVAIIAFTWAMLALAL